MRSWTTFRQTQSPNSWDNLQNKPAILSDNQISWNEITNIPINISNFLSRATTPKGKFNDYLLGVYQSSTEITYKWQSLNSNVSAYSVALRDSSGNLKANNFVAQTMPISPTGLSVGTFYKDSNGFVKIV
ncbi:MAG TPA: hypothetical protein DDZ60_10285 [Planktothrix sp. UBA10369]|jgi:hypothetical protein|nr:hypothetical protein [Planktothrix sp. UBA10369]